MSPFRDRWPVIEGEFPTGTELMLWRPGIDRSRLRRRAFRAAVFSSPATYLLLVTTLIAMSAGCRQVSWIFGILTVLILMRYALVVGVNYGWADRDHQHGPDKPCFLDRTCGEYFYRPSDFRDLPLSILYSANAIIATVRGVYASPAAAWVEPQHLREIHQLAWDALRVLDQTRTLRMLVADPRYQATSGDLLDARACLSAIDDMLDGIVNWLHQVTMLLQAWEQKLAEADLRSQLRAEGDNVPAGTMASVLRRAESLTESVFAYVTAARDVTNAGSFVWERAQP